MLRRWFVLLLIVGVVCIAKKPLISQPEPTPTQASNTVVTLAQTQQTDAPALLYNGGQVIAVWIGSDERGVHQDARRIGEHGLSDVVTLPLPPTHPYDQQLFPGLDGAAHLLWLDADSSQQTTLYSALLAPDLSVERGPVSVSEGLALDFSAVPDGAGGLWTAWSGGQIAESTLYVRRIDEEGRPLLDKVALATNGDHPALVRNSDGAVWLFWLSGGQLLRQRIDVSDQTPEILTSTVNLTRGSQLVNVRAALDATKAYFFWNITHANGMSETWWTAGALAANSWRQPVRLSTGIGTPLRWTILLLGQPQTQIAAIESDDGLGIISLRDGVVTGYTIVQPGTSLIGSPALTFDGSGGLDLAWSAPGETTTSLRLITIRQ